MSLYIFVSIVYFLIVPHMSEEKPERHGALTNVEADSLHKELKNNAFVPAVATRKLNATLDSGATFQKLSAAEQVHFVDSLRLLSKANPADHRLEERFDRYNDLLTDRQDTSLAAYQAHQKTLSASAKGFMVAEVYAGEDRL